MLNAMGRRLPALDILRAIAILLVLGRHMTVPTAVFPFNRFLEAWQRGGWVGVDLFFVLSGFLVSGLLFDDHRNSGQLHIGRFLFRRALKIYPPFYLLLLVSAAWWGATRSLNGISLACELLYVQNYCFGVWPHTWSLAVEEHFYILLPLTLFVLVNRDQLKRLPAIVFGVALGALALRLLTVATFPYSNMTNLYPTGLRLDSLAFGVLLSYYAHLHHDHFMAFAHGHRLALVAVGIILLTPAFIVEVELGNPLMDTIGLTLFYLGSGALLVALLPLRPCGPVSAVLGDIGRRSYSIYLWHVAARDLVYAILAPGSLLALGLYLAAALLMGSLLHAAWEAPMLRLRDRLLPSQPAEPSPALAPIPGPNGRSI